MNRLYAVLAASLFVSSVTLPAHAATRDEETQACRGDAMHFCSAEIPNEEKITACMKQHINELSPGCRAMFKGGKKSDANKNSQ